MTFGKKLLAFYRSLDASAITAPAGITTMNPYRDEQILGIIERFLKKYYNDENPRTFIFGINPGRFGAGVTGITFTDPIRLEKNCGILNDLSKKPELSSVFIYDMIDRFGGAEKFYSEFYLTALSPLGFMKNGRNMNYYDDRALENAAYPFIIESIRKQMKFGCNPDKAICLGEGKNFRFFEKLNEEFHFFKEIVPLAHPRFIMQYRLKKKEEYITSYIDVLRWQQLSD